MALSFSVGIAPAVFAQTLLNNEAQYLYNKTTFGTATLESGLSTIGSVRDWELVVGYNYELINGGFRGFNRVGISKRLGRHGFYAEIVPQRSMSFSYESPTTILTTDTLEIPSKETTRLSAEERFGFGYSLRAFENLSMGISMRSFTQSITNEKPTPIIEDTLSYIVNESNTFNQQVLRVDLSAQYSFYTNLFIGVSAHNIGNLVLKEETLEGIDYALRYPKQYSLYAGWQPFESTGLFLSYETDNSYIVSLSQSLNLLGGILEIGGGVFRESERKGAVSGMQLGVRWEQYPFSFSVSGVAYLNQRPSTIGLKNFLEEGVSSLENNRFSENYVSFTLRTAVDLTTIPKIKMIDVEIREEIYPTLGEYYLFEPFASALVKNISDEIVEVIPASFIQEINEEKVYSPTVSINPGDTARVNFFTGITPRLEQAKKRNIEMAEFYLYTGKNTEEGMVQKPVLVNTANSWNSKVSTLRYFVEAQYFFAQNYSKKVLALFQDSLQRVPQSLKVFTISKILFENAVSNMNYVSDPRSSTDFVQFPEQTLELKGGDCDDISVLVAALLQSVGIQCAFIDYSNSPVRHVSLMINTGVTPENKDALSINEQKLFIRESSSGRDELWIPIEVTEFASFNESWNKGSEMFRNEAVENLGLAKGLVKIIDF